MTDFFLTVVATCKWIPAFVGMTWFDWIPAFAGMTDLHINGFVACAGMTCLSPGRQACLRRDFGRQARRSRNGDDSLSQVLYARR